MAVQLKNTGIVGCSSANEYLVEPDGSVGNMFFITIILALTYSAIQMLLLMVYIKMRIYGLTLMCVKL